MPAPFASNDYKVGIICALPLERTAVEAMLDKWHEKQPRQPDDHNEYSFGEIGKHNVIIASLGHGAYGTVSAAEVTNDIRRSFPKLKYGLMVGIAGAVPRPNSEDGDIRLGDIVVGCAKGVPSIINYSLGKATVNDFEIRSVLAEPSAVLLRAVAALESKHQRLGPTYLIHLSDMLKNNDERYTQPRLRRDYFDFPDAADCLFEAQSVHSPHEQDCKRCVLLGFEVMRNPRFMRRPPKDLLTEKFIRYRDDGWTDYPAVFFGSIGSSDIVMKDAVRRDQVYEMVKQQSKAKLLCFETIASGVIRAWPSLVIRGICNYSDSHKNDDWQNFAAATAAAYAKDLLLCISPDVAVKAKSGNDSNESTAERQPHSTITQTGPGNMFINGSGIDTNNYYPKKKKKT